MRRRPHPHIHPVLLLSQGVEGEKRRRCKTAQFFNANLKFHSTLDSSVHGNRPTRSVSALKFPEREGEGVHRRQVSPRDRAEHPSQAQDRGWATARRRSRRRRCPRSTCRDSSQSGGRPRPPELFQDYDAFGQRQADDFCVEGGQHEQFGTLHENPEISEEKYT